MGRALYSQAYPASPVVRTEPEPCVYETWSKRNAFDPDSDEFFSDAEYEAFIDPVQYRQAQEEQAMAVEAASPASSDSSEGSESDRGSPMAVGPDDPAILIANAYSSVDWEQRFLQAGSAETEWRRLRDDRRIGEAAGYARISPLFVPRAPRPAEAGDTLRSGRITRPRSATVSSVPAFLPPSSLRNSTTATEINAQRSPSAYLRRTVNITPITIPVTPSTPGPLSPMTPPAQNMYQRDVQTMTTPSPPPTVTPRLYNWNRHPPTSPSSPSHVQGNGPLTNPNARMSLTHININPRMVRNAVI